MPERQIDAARDALTAALAEYDCRTVPDLMTRLGVPSGAALLARLGCSGNPDALWERVTEAVAEALLPEDALTPLIAAWYPEPEALREFGVRALRAGADPRSPTLSPDAKGALLSRLSRPSQVAFETYALAREVAIAVRAGLRDAE